MLSAVFRSTYLVLSTRVVGHPLPISLSGNLRNGLGINTTMKNSLFERSEFLIATSKKKKTDRLCVCVDVRLILVLVLGRQTVYGQNTVYLCLSKYIVFENTHTHTTAASETISTAASETEGVAAVLSLIHI